MPERADVLFGILYFDPERQVSVEALRRVARVVGAPDAELSIDRNLGLGLRRNVVDAEGQAASVAQTGDDWVAVTGEIENQPELIASLRQRGLDPSSGSDADVVGAILRADGVAGVAAVRGYFNAVIWNRTSRDLVLLADRCGGVKAMYHCQQPAFLAFGSTLKAVVAHDEVPRRMDPTSFEDLFVLRHPVSPRTMLSDVAVLEAGTCLEIRGGVSALRRYWQRRPRVDDGVDLVSLRRNYFDALQQAVARSAGGGEASVMLSGGVDSAALVSLLRRQGQRRIKTFSVHIGDAERSDRGASQAIAQRFGTEHRSLDDLDERCLDALPEMIWQHESPVVNVHPTYWLGRMMREECNVVLAGYGNDIVWGSVAPDPVTPAWARRLCPPLNELHYLYVRRRLGRRALRLLCPSAAATDLGVLRRIARSRLTSDDGLSGFIALDAALFGDQVVDREIGKFLVDAHGLWPRMPYADARVAAAAEAVPPALRLRRLGRRRTELKSFFKDVMNEEGVLPPELIYRRKIWMFSPTAQWLRGDLHRVAQAVLQSSRLRQRGLFDHNRIARLLGEHRAGTRDHSFVLMMAVAVEVWHRLFVDPASLASPDFTLADCAMPERP